MMLLSSVAFKDIVHLREVSHTYPGTYAKLETTSIVERSFQGGM